MLSQVSQGLQQRRVAALLQRSLGFAFAFWFWGSRAELLFAAAAQEMLLAASRGK